MVEHSIGGTKKYGTISKNRLWRYISQLEKQSFEKYVLSFFVLIENPWALYHYKYH